MEYYCIDYNIHTISYPQLTQHWSMTEASRWWTPPIDLFQSTLVPILYPSGWTLEAQTND